jgi:hypothetical protein
MTRSTGQQSDAPPAIQVVFVDGEGNSNNGLRIQLSAEKKLPAAPYHKKWSRRTTIRKFMEMLTGTDGPNFEAVIQALNRHDCWRDALDQLQRAAPDSRIGSALLSFWFTYGLCSIPRALKSDLAYPVDAFRCFLPPYPGPAVTLYRGELESRHEAGIYGISWTPRLEVARMFARRRWPDEGRGVVLQLEATPDMIVAAVSDHSQHTLYLGEDEYLVDPRQVYGRISVIKLGMTAA